MNARRVSFGDIEIIELPMIIGVPSSEAPTAPLSVDWKFQKRTSFRVDFFEKYRPKRRPPHCLRLSSKTREDILLNQGFTIDEIKKGCSNSVDDTLETTSPPVQKTEEDECCYSRESTESTETKLQILESHERMTLSRIQQLHDSIFVLSSDEGNYHGTPLYPK